ncbi:MAG TPA: hypothetical protein VGO93_27855, partial [Candidatus Xenobia bacterium]
MGTFILRFAGLAFMPRLASRWMQGIGRHGAVLVLAMSFAGLLMWWHGRPTADLSLETLLANHLCRQQLLQPAMAPPASDTTTITTNLDGTPRSTTY